MSLKDLISDIAPSQDVCVRFSVIDQDRHCGPVEIGSTSVTLKVMIMFKMMIMVLVVMIYPQEAKQTGPDPDKFSSSQILSPPKKVKPILKPPEISSPSKSHHHCAFFRKYAKKSFHKITSYLIEQMNILLLQVLQHLLSMACLSLRGRYIYCCHATMSFITVHSPFHEQSNITSVRLS